MKGRRTNGTFGSTTITFTGGGAFTTGGGPFAGFNFGISESNVSFNSMDESLVYFLKLPRIS